MIPNFLQRNFPLDMKLQDTVIILRCPQEFHSILYSSRLLNHFLSESSEFYAKLTFEILDHATHAQATT